MTTTDFLASLPAALSLRGSNSSSVADVVATIRAELAKAVKCGAIPAGTKFSVRTHGHKSITVDVSAWQGAVFTSEYMTMILVPSEARETRHRDRLVPALVAVLSFVEALADRHNFNESRSEEDYFHYGYSLNVTSTTIESNATRGARLESDPEFSKLVKLAALAAKRVGPKVVKSVLGRLGLEAAGEWELKRLLKIDAMANGRPLVYCKQRSRWIVDDTATDVETIAA